MHAMQRQRTVVGMGELLWADGPDGIDPRGVAAEVPAAAVALGHVGVAVSRLGQDAPALELTAALREAGVDVHHLQSDPDLATGRIVATTRGNRLPPEAAFDRVQWDYDLSDLAQRSDIVVVSALACRHGQTRAVIHQLLDECTTSLRAVDLTIRGDRPLDRAALAPVLQRAAVVVVDDAALAALAVARGDDGGLDAARRLHRRDDVDVVLYASGSGDGAITLHHTAQEGSTSAARVPPGGRITAIVAFLLALRDGADPERSLADAAEAAAERAARSPSAPD